jgi:hypothetical protein
LCLYFFTALSIYAFTFYLIYYLDPILDYRHWTLFPAHNLPQRKSVFAHC